MEPPIPGKLSSSKNYVNKLRKNQRNRAIIENVIKLIFTFAIFGYSAWYIFSQLTIYNEFDFDVYLGIYSSPITEWYDAGTYYYYSPLFYLLFYPFFLLSCRQFVILGSIFYFWGLYQCFEIDLKYYLMLCLHLGTQYWVIVRYGNVDLYLFGLVVWLWKSIGKNPNRKNTNRKNPNKKKNEILIGFLLGILTFKGTIGYIIPFFLWKSRQKKKFVISVAMGISLNYCWLLCFPGLLEAFLHQIMLPDHMMGPIYLSGIHYTWLVGIIILFWHDIGNRIQKGKPKL
jgi:Glycosyltransferase family 87